MLTPDYPPNIFGGIGVHVEKLVNELLSLENEVTVVVGNLGKYNSYFHAKNKGLEIYNFPIVQENYDDTQGFWPFDFTNLNRQLLPMLLESSIDFEEYDVIHLHDFYHSFVAIAIHELYGIPIVSTMHSLSEYSNHFIDFAKRYTILNSDEVIVVSNYLKEEIEREINVKLNVVLNGTEFQDKKLSEKQNKLANERSKKITFSGRLVETKGCEYLIRALQSIDSEYNLHIMGDGTLRKDLEELVDSLNLNSRVVFHGFISQKDVMENIRDSEVHVVPSLVEPFGLSLVEAMAEGVPVICSDVGGMREIVNNGWNGIKVPPKSVEDLAKAINIILSNQELSKTYVNHGLEFVKRNSWNNKAIEIMKIYERVLGRKPKEKYHFLWKYH